MKKFYSAMLMVGFVFAFFGALYAGHIDNAKAMVRYMIPWFIWEMFFAVMWVNEDTKKIPDRWISVEDRLPSIGSKVWVGRYGKVPAVMEAIFDGDGFVDPEQYGWTYSSKFKDPTHWQPEYIPSPPTNIHKGVN